MTKSRLARGEGGSHPVFAVAEGFSVRSNLRNTKATGGSARPHRGVRRSSLVDWRLLTRLLQSPVAV
eukprot:scaffold8149_cov31-Phaeocystis_antarctica.AAC.1